MKLIRIILIGISSGTFLRIILCYKTKTLLLIFENTKFYSFKISFMKTNIVRKWFFVPCGCNLCCILYLEESSWNNSWYTNEQNCCPLFLRKKPWICLKLCIRKLRFILSCILTIKNRRFYSVRLKYLKLPIFNHSDL